MPDLDQWWHDLSDNPLAQLVAFALIYAARYLVDRALATKAKAKHKHRKAKQNG